MACPSLEYGNLPFHGLLPSCGGNGGKEGTKKNKSATNGEPASEWDQEAIAWGPVVEASMESFPLCHPLFVIGSLCRSVISQTEAKTHFRWRELYEHTVCMSGGAGGWGKGGERGIDWARVQSCSLRKTLVRKSTMFGTSTPYEISNKKD